MKRRAVLRGLAGGFGAAALPAMLRAQASGAGEHASFGCPPVTECTSVFVAAHEGYFSKRKLDLEVTLIPAVSATIPAALQAGSLQIGMATPSTFLHAVDGGLDHVILCGGGVISKRITSIGLVARAGSQIRAPQDCLERKIAVPGLNAFLHVTFREWLRRAGVDHRRVQFVEVPFAQQADLLRRGSIDAAVTVDPFMARIVDSGAGYVAAYYTTFLEDGHHTVYYVATRAWATAHPAAVKAFREGVKEAAELMLNPAHDARVRVAVGRYLKLPPELLARTQISPPGPAVTSRHLQFWVGLMKDQKLLRAEPDLARLVF